MAVMSKEELEDITGNITFPLLFRKHHLQVVGEFSSGSCFLRGLYVGPGVASAYDGGEGCFWIDYAGSLQVPDSAEELKQMLDDCAARQDQDVVNQAIQARGPIELPEGRDIADMDNYICPWVDSESICLDPVNEWALMLMHESDGWGGHQLSASEAMLRFTAVLWTEDGVERPWQTIPAADRSAVCDLIIAASVDHEEQFSKLTGLLKGLLWPNFWAEIESHQWANLEAMIESM